MHLEMHVVVSWVAKRNEDASGSDSVLREDVAFAVEVLVGRRRRRRRTGKCTLVNV